MKFFTTFFALGLILSITAEAKVLSPQEANVICHNKALRAAHFIAETTHKFKVTYKADVTAEISTGITYSFSTPGSDEALYTVVAYAYPDTRTCTLGSIVSNIAGND